MKLCLTKLNQMSSVRVLPFENGAFDNNKVPSSEPSDSNL